MNNEALTHEAITLNLSVHEILHILGEINRLLIWVLHFSTGNEFKCCNTVTTNNLSTQLVFQLSVAYI